MKALEWCTRYALVGTMVGICFLRGQMVLGQITGTVFRDFDGDGVQDSGEPGISNIVVKAYANAVLPEKDQTVGMTITSSNGTYVLNPPIYPVRLEFEMLFNIHMIFP